MDYQSNSTAILDVVIENKDISNIFRESDQSSVCSNSLMENSLVQSPSLESFSTIADTEILSELNIDENEDISIKVDSPQKHLDTLETFITFRLTTRVARIEFSENEYIVRRRYNEFVWLRQKLIESHPFCIVPPLPAKHTLIGQLDRYSKDFILVRMKLLQIFMCRLVQHPILSCNEHFKVFITANQSDFTLHRKHRSNLTNRNPVAYNAVTSYSTIKNRQIEFERMKEYVSVLTEKLGAIDKISSRIIKERQEYVYELQTLYPIFSHWSLNEPELAVILQSISNAFEKNSSAQSVIICSYSNTLGNPIKEFLLYIDVVKETLVKRENFQQIYESSLDDLVKRRTEKDQLLVTSSHPGSGFSLWKHPSSDEKLERLGVHIPQLMKKVEANQDNLECANECLRSDLERWQLEKQTSLKKIMLDFVNKQIEYYEKSINAWDIVVSELNAQNISFCGFKK